MMGRQEELMRICAGYALVIFDNRPALFTLEDANSAEAWAMLNLLMRMIANTGPAVLMMAHEGKGEGVSSFGSSAQEWVTDTIFRISNRDVLDKERQHYPDKLPTRKIVFTKSRMCALPDQLEFYFSEDDMSTRLICVQVVKK